MKMRHILEFNQYDLGDNQHEYTVVRWEFGNPENEGEYFSRHNVGDVDYFDVWVETPEGEEEKISVNYEMFLDHMKESMPNLRSYLATANFDDMKIIFDDLQDLGFDIQDQIQSWVDYNVTQDTIDAAKDGETEEEDDEDFEDFEDFEDESEEDFDDESDEDFNDEDF
jgi:hypothetical protein